jgi:hypothetical protein
MLERFGLENKILMFNGDNASSNDTQAVALDGKKNSFHVENCIRCFNHTIQLAAKALLRPFYSHVTRDAGDDETADEIPDLIDYNDDDGDDDGDNDDDGDEEDDNDDINEDDSNVDGLRRMSEMEQAEFQEETAIVKQTITKVRIIQLFLSVQTNSI